VTISIFQSVTAPIAPRTLSYVLDYYDNYYYCINFLVDITSPEYRQTSLLLLSLPQTNIIMVLQV